MANTLKFGNGEWYGKKDTILAYNSENNNYKPLPFDFSRGSSATVVNKDGLIETVGSGEPRVDYKDNTKGALLLEPSRTNLITYSEALSNTLVKSGTYTDNFAISPDGTQNATKLTATNADPYFYQDLTFLSSSYTVSIYLKGIGSSIGKNFQIRLAGNIYTDVIPSDWTRFEYTQTISSGAASVGLEIPNPAVTGDEVLVWGWQLEQGSYATSYIPTSGSAVTRVADSTSQTVPDGVIGQTEGTIYFEFEDLDYSYTSIARAVSLSDGTSTNRIYIAQLSSGAMYAITTGGCEIQETAPSGRRNNLKVAFGYKNNDCVLYVNGVLAGVDNSATTPICSKVHLGNFNNTANLNKPYKEVKLYNTRLSNTELQALTTI